MPDRIILASGSAIRAQLLRNAGVPFEVDLARVDEAAVRLSLTAENASPRDIADALAELKAQKVAARAPDALVIGCDQVLALGTEIFAKPESRDDLFDQLTRLAGKTHQLLSAAVLYGEGRPLWRHVGVVRMHMRRLDPGWLRDYIDRNWEEVRHSVGGYHLEAEGARLFERVEGDYFSVLGLPLLPLLSYLTQRGTLPG